MEDLSVEALRLLYAAAKSGHYAYATALALVLVVALVRRYAAPRVAWLASDAGGAALALFGSFGAALAAALASGDGLSWRLVWAAIGVAVTAAGGYSLVKRLIVTPILVPLSKRAPAWMQPLIALALFAFESKADAAARKQAAGDAAVAAKPAAGVDAATPLDHDVS